jgi:hypothetical protein
MYQISSCTHIGNKKVFTKLIGLQYMVVYRKGSENRVADALSRHPSPPAQPMALSGTIPVWLDKVQEGYNTNPKSQQLITALAADPHAIANYTLINGILRYKNRVWIVDNPNLQQTILQALHALAIGGHSEFPITYRKMKQLFA